MPITHDASDDVAANTPDSKSTLRARAEAQMDTARAESGETLSLDQVRQVLHELRVHQVELEIQNEELRRAQGELEIVHARYFDLYHLAPVGYVTLNPRGQIIEANLRAATILGEMRGYLAGQPLSRYIVPADQGQYYSHLQHVFALGTPQVCQVRIKLPTSGEAVWVRMESMQVQVGETQTQTCRTTLSDITAQIQAQAALQQSEERFRMLVERVSKIAVQGYASDSRVILWNKASEELYGYSAAEAQGKNLVDLIIPPEMRAQVRQAIAQMMATGESIPAAEIELMRKDGSRVAVFSNHTVTEVSGRGKEFYCIDIDLTERKQMEGAFRTAHQRLDALVSNLYAGVMLVAEDGKIEYVNQAFCDLFDLTDTPASLRGLTSAERVGKFQTAYVLPDQELEHIRKIRAVGEPVRNEEVAMTRGRVYLRDFIPIVVDGQRQGRVWVFHDITARKRLEDELHIVNLQLEKQLGELQNLHLQLREQAIRDPLTQLYNRRYLNETFPREIALALRHEYAIGVLMLDVDRFKEVNDAYGHLVGDETLQAIAHALTTHLRTSDIVCRYGGEEFLCLLVNTTPEFALQRAEQLRTVIANLPVTPAHPRGQVTVSIGVALLPPHGSDMIAILKAADQALYQAKMDGRNCVRLAQLNSD